MQITSSFGSVVSSFGEAAFRQAEDSQPVPEPSTVLGLGLASFGMFLMGKSKQKKDRDKA